MTGSLTCVRGCASKGRHLDECASGDDCWGCLPRLAADGLQVCSRCERLTREWIRELPGLYDDLLEPSKTTPGLSERVDAEISRPALVSDRSNEERHAIRAIAVSWMFVLIEEREMSAPEDTVAAMAARLGIHAGWLLASVEHAYQLVDDLQSTVHRGRCVAYPVRPDSHPLGNCPVEVDDGIKCGEMIRARPTDEFVTCRKCGTEAVITWWQKAIHADDEEAPLLTGAQAASLLSWEYKRIVTEAVIRQWAVRAPREYERAAERRDERLDAGKELRPEDELPPVFERVGRDDRGRTLYVRDDLLRYAEWKLAKRAA